MNLFKALNDFKVTLKDHRMFVNNLKEDRGGQTSMWMTFYNSFDKKD